MSTGAGPQEPLNASVGTPPGLPSCSLSPPQDAVRIMAKDLVRTRRYVRKFVLMRANIQAVSLKIQTLKSNNSMAQAMKGVTKAMGTMNRQVRLSPSPLPPADIGPRLTLLPLSAEVAPDPEDHDGV